MNVFICLLDCAYEAPQANHIRMQNVARIAFIIKEVWNPVCCHGNRTVKLIVEQIYCK